MDSSTCRAVPDVAAARAALDARGRRLAEARRFLDTIAPEAESWCFQTVGDTGQRGDLARTLHGSLPDLFDTLDELNRQGAGVFLTVNEIPPGAPRRAENVCRVRAVFADFDGTAPPDRYILAPVLEVESSPGKRHAYWTVDGLPLEGFEPQQRGIAAALGSDPAVIDLPRVMRLPGFRHMKDPSRPHWVRIIATDERLPYTPEAIAAAFPPVAKANGTGHDRPDPGADPIARALDNRGLVLRAKPGGGLFIKCPWGDEHTTPSSPTATVYYPPHTGGYAGAAFKCQHGHCQGRTCADLRLRLEVDETAREQLKQDKHVEVEESAEAALARLAALPPLEYDRSREAEAAHLKVRVGTLDTEVKQRRKTEERNDTPLVEEVESWPAPVDGRELLEEIKATITRYMVMPDGADTALSLWTLGSYAFDAFRIWPKLTLTSPEKRCGKSTLLAGILTPLVHRGLVTSNISPAAIFRVIEAWKPTLMIDEADTFLHGNDEMRGVINSGHTKSGAFVVRTVGDEHEPKKFSTWAPMAIAMIKTPPGTILDRSIVVRLRRKLPRERMEKLPLIFEDNCLPLRRRCKRWAEDNLEGLRIAAPTLPVSANDRALDNWTPILAIAETVGGTWHEEATAAFHHLTIEDDDDAIGPMILEDIKRVFDEQRVERLHSADLVSYLIDLEERPWAEWRHGKPLTTTSLARLLKHHQLKSKQLWIKTTNRHGYELKDFRDAFDRYLTPVPSTPPIQNARTLEPSNGAGSSQIQNTRDDSALAFQYSRQPSNGAGSSVLASQNGKAEGEGCSSSRETTFKEEF